MKKIIVFIFIGVMIIGSATGVWLVKRNNSEKTADKEITSSVSQSYEFTFEDMSEAVPSTTTATKSFVETTAVTAVKNDVSKPMNSKDKNTATTQGKKPIKAETTATQKPSTPPDKNNGTNIGKYSVAKGLENMELISICECNKETVALTKDTNANYWFCISSDGERFTKTNLTEGIKEIFSIDTAEKSHNFYSLEEINGQVFLTGGYEIDLEDRWEQNFMFIYSNGEIKLAENLPDLLAPEYASIKKCNGKYVYFQKNQFFELNYEHDNFARFYVSEDLNSWKEYRTPEHGEYVSNPELNYEDAYYSNLQLTVWENGIAVLGFWSSPADSFFNEVFQFCATTDFESYTDLDKSIFALNPEARYARDMFVYGFGSENILVGVADIFADWTEEWVSYIKDFAVYSVNIKTGKSTEIYSVSDKNGSDKIGVDYSVAVREDGSFRIITTCDNGKTGDLVYSTDAKSFIVERKFEENEYNRMVVDFSRIRYSGDIDFDELIGLLTEKEKEYITVFSFKTGKTAAVAVDKTKKAFVVGEKIYLDTVNNGVEIYSVTDFIA